MEHDTVETAGAAPRRSIFGRIVGAMAVGLAGLAAVPARAQTTVPGDGPDWPGKLTGRHKQVVDATEVDGGNALAFVTTFLSTNASPGAASAALVIRHVAVVMGLNDAMWDKYKIGTALKINDPETKAPATKNPFLRPKPGVLLTDDMAIDKLLAAGTVVGACNVAIHVLSKSLASNAGLSADEAAKDWIANVVPGVSVIPSGTWGVNRAQEAGCTYCSGA